MALAYDDIARFMKAYFTAYSEKGQTAETQHVMDSFYAPDIYFDDGTATRREDWYKACLRHPAVQDKLTLKHLVVDEKQQEAVALAKTQAIERATGKVLVEMKLSVLYAFKADDGKNIRITHVKIFLEPDPQKTARLAQAYNIGGGNP